jgi:hypothetical protein
MAGRSERQIDVDRKPGDTLVSAVVQAPVDLMEAVAALRLPAKADERLQDLMDRNNNGRLRPEEREDLEYLAELSETLSLVRAKALHLLGRKPA